MTDLKKTAGIIILSIWSLSAFGQYRDAGLWASLSIRYEPAKKWKIGLEEEARFFENITRLNKINSELTVNYQLSKWLDIGILYRLISNYNPGNRFDFNHRFSVSLGAGKKFSGWTCSMKTAFQKTYPEFRNTSESHIPENYVRALAEVSRELKNKKTEPYTNIEFWYRLTAGEQAFTDQYRFTLGVKHKLNKSNRLNVYCRIQQKLQVRNPLTAFIVGVGYGFLVRR